MKILSDIMNQELFLEDLLGYNSSVSGSNNWVISGSRTKSGKPLLANDPHLKFTQPPRWYEMHLKGGRFNVSGLCLAGIPMPIIGQNEHIAWGLTNSMVDDMDSSNASSVNRSRIQLLPTPASPITTTLNRWS